jgi:hypothetical protein
VPLLGPGLTGVGEQEGHAATPAVDWATVHGIVELAKFEGTVLDWLRLQQERQERQQPEAGARAESEVAAPGHLSVSSAVVRRALTGRVLITTHNNTAYLYRCVCACVFVCVWGGGARAA